MKRDRVKNAVREVTVPEGLTGASDAEVYEWAKEQLYGVDPDLKQGDIDGIKRGDIRKITLRPSKPGVFLEDGTFLPALDYDVKLGEDLDDVEEALEEEARRQEWIEEEAERFNRQTVPDGEAIRAMWEHGRRMARFLEETGMAPHNLHQKLDKAGGLHGYSHRSHYVSGKLYEWRPSASEDDPIFDWTWQLMDAVLNLSNSDQVRDSAAELVENHLLPSGVSMAAAAYFLRGPTHTSSRVWRDADEFLEKAYSRIETGRELDEGSVEELIARLTEV